ncbi:SLA class II histocompatibility antigen, DQ haplotype D beta chain-like isoform X1 [Aquarana catesbeiana]
MIPVCYPLLLSLLLLPGLLSASHPDDFMYQFKGQCYYRNGTEDIWSVSRYMYNQEEYLYFDSDKGFFIPVTELGRLDAESYNKNPDILERNRAEVETICKHNYQLYKALTVDLKSEPKIRIIYAPSTDPEYENILSCFVEHFFPSMINITWLKNGVEESDKVTSSELLNDGDWTYQIHVNLETTIQHGDVFTCRVEHSSWTTPREVQWKFETSESARSKMLTGIVGFVLGVVFFIVGLLVYLRNTKGARFLPVQQNISFHATGMADCGLPLCRAVRLS